MPCIHRYQKAWVLEGMGTRRHGYSKAWVLEGMGTRRHGYSKAWVLEGMVVDYLGIRVSISWKVHIRYIGVRSGPDGTGQYYTSVSFCRKFRTCLEKVLSSCGGETVARGKVIADCCGVTLWPITWTMATMKRS